MKHKITLFTLLGTTLGFSQDYSGRVGVNTETPNATLEVKGSPNDTEVIDGFIPPKITFSQITAKTNYNHHQTGALIYITDATNSEGIYNHQNQFIRTQGYYYWNGTTWRPLKGKDGELVRIETNTNRYGWGLPYRLNNPHNYDTIGEYAVDFSLSQVLTSRTGEQYGATGRASFAIGTHTIASGGYSFAHGERAFATGGYSYAGGVGTKATNFASHAEGQVTTASGWASHSEGYNTIADGTSSHAQGNSTIANSFAEHSRGTYNFSPTPYSKTSFDKRDLIESVGGGTGFISTGVYHRTNLFKRYKSGAFKYNAQELNSANIPNASKGFHASDLNGKLNYHNGNEWETYITMKFADTEPNTAKKGDLYFNTQLNTYFAYDGTSWRSLW